MENYKQIARLDYRGQSADEVKAFLEENKNSDCVVIMISSKVADESVYQAIVNCKCPVEIYSNDPPSIASIIWAAASTAMIVWAAVSFLCYTFHK